MICDYVMSTHFIWLIVGSSIRHQLTTGIHVIRSVNVASDYHTQPLPPCPNSPERLGYATRHWPECQVTLVGIYI